MNSYYAKLHKDWSLRGWLDVPAIAVNHKNGQTKILNKKQFYVLKSCDGETNFNSLAFLPIHLEILERLIQFNIVCRCKKQEKIELFQYYKYIDIPFIKTIQWCITGKCNLKCIHCFMESPSGKYGEPSFESIKILIDQFEEANVINVALTGGEPFLRQDIMDIVSLLKEKRIHIEHIFTNGLLVTNKHLQKFKELDIFPSFQISFDGVGKHDYMRGTKGVEHTVINAIQQIQKAGFHVIVSTSIDKRSIDCLISTYELMRQLKVKSWRISTPQESGNWKGNQTALSLEELNRELHIIWKRWNDDKQPFAIQLGGFFSGKKGDKNPILNKKFTAASIDCKTCKEQAYLLPNGTLLPCAGYVDSIIEKTMPSLFENHLLDVWKCSNLYDIANLTKQDILKENKECRDCEVFSECGSGCRASALVETGKILQKDPVACTMWKNRFRDRYHV